MITYTEPLDLTVRPIIGRPKCPTRKLSNVVDILIKPFLTPMLTHMPCFVKDNLTFLNKCQ